MVVPEKRQLVLHSASAATPVHDVHIEGEKTQQKAIQRWFPHTCLTLDFVTGIQETQLMCMPILSESDQERLVGSMPLRAASQSSLLPQLVAHEHIICLKGSSRGIDRRTIDPLGPYITWLEVCSGELKHCNVQ